MGVPKTIRQLDAIGRALLATDLFPSAEPAGVHVATKVTAQQIKDFIGAVANAARNGLLENGGFAEWGQAFGTLLDPAALLHNIEIPDAGFLIFFGKNNGVDPVIAFDVAGGGLQISNSPGGNPKFTIFDGQQYSFQSDGSGSVCKIGFDSGLQLSFDKTIDGGNGGALVASNAIVPDKNFILPIAVLTGLVNGITRNSAMLNKCDSTAGNVAIQIDPVITNGSTFVFKKISGDANTVTITPQTGTIQELGAPAASLIFSGQGESFSIFSDGTNLFAY